MNQPNVTLSPNAYYLRGGRIVNDMGENVFPEAPRFDDSIDACYWLHFVSPEGQFGTAYLEETR